MRHLPETGGIRGPGPGGTNNIATTDKRHCTSN